MGRFIIALRAKNAQVLKVDQGHKCYRSDDKGYGNVRGRGMFSETFILVLKVACDAK